MKFNRLMVLVVAAALAQSCVAYGLERLIEVPETSDEQRRTARQQYLNDLISSIQKACDLTEAELRRLQVASKGAVEYSFTDPVHGDDSRRRRREIVWQLEIRQGQAQWVNSLDAAAAARHPIWTRTLERTLTSEQLETAQGLAKQQHERWTQRFVQPVILKGFKNGAPMRGGKLLKIREVQPIEINQLRRLDLIIQPLPRNR